jgi:hypothetical protein
MTVSSGFFNSDGGDRTYNAADMGELFDGIIVDGVFSTVGDSFAVTPGTGLAVQVASGRAWFIRSWLYNDGPIQLNLAGADPSQARKDAVYLDFNKTDGVRANTIKVRTGTPSGTPTPPSMTVEEDHVEVAIAYITVNAGATSISQGNIEYLVGGDSCPFATGLLTQLSATQLLLQWNAEFYDWFNNLQDMLDENAETNLQDQLDILNERVLKLPPRKGRNLVDNSAFLIHQRSSNDFTVPTGPSTFDDFLWPDRWGGYLRAASYGVQQYDQATYDGKEWLRLIIGGDVANSVNRLHQMRHAVGVYDARKFLIGTPDARPGWLSFLFRSNVTGVYNVRIQNPTSGKVVRFEFDYTVADAVTRQSFKVPADIDPTNALPDDIGSAGLTIIFDLGTGSDFLGGSTPTGTWSTIPYPDWYTDSSDFGLTNGDYAMITEVQLEVGDYLTEYEEREEWEHLLDCQKRVWRATNHPVVWRDSSLSGRVQCLVVPPRGFHGDIVGGDVSEYAGVFSSGLTNYNAAGNVSIYTASLVGNHVPSTVINIHQQYTGQAYDGLTNVGDVSFLVDIDIK